MILAQVLERDAASDYKQWLNYGLWALLAICVGAVIVGGATAYLSGQNGNASSRTWGLRMVAAGLLGALVAPVLHQIIDWSWELVNT